MNVKRLKEVGSYRGDKTYCEDCQSEVSEQKQIAEQFAEMSAEQWVAVAEQNQRHKP
jgi:hypothetical protein